MELAIRIDVQPGTCMPGNIHIVSYCDLASQARADSNRPVILHCGTKARVTAPQRHLGILLSRDAAALVLLDQIRSGARADLNPTAPELHKRQKREFQRLAKSCQ